MSNDQFIDFPISFENLMSSLFGKTNFHGTTGYIPLENWKKYILRIFKALKTSICVNIDIADLAFRSKIISICDEAIIKLEEAENMDEINTITIERLVKLTFMLQGGLPNNWNKKSVNLPHNWKLNTFRKVVYLQTDKNKVDIILNTYKNDEDIGDLYNKLNRDYKRNYSRFLDWFKKEYPERYSDIF